MKLTKEDIKKYGMEKEKKILNEGAGGLYVVIGSWKYEGSDSPVGIFNSLKKAKKVGEEIAKFNYDDVDIFQYKMNHFEQTRHPTLILKIK